MLRLLQELKANNGTPPGANFMRNWRKFSSEPEALRSSPCRSLALFTSLIHHSPALALGSSKSSSHIGNTQLLCDESGEGERTRYGAGCNRETRHLQFGGEVSTGVASTIQHGLEVVSLPV